MRPLVFLERQWDYINAQYGTVGVIVTGVVLVVALVSFFIWMDRRR